MHGRAQGSDISLYRWVYVDDADKSSGGSSGDGLQCMLLSMPRTSDARGDRDGRGVLPVYVGEEVHNIGKSSGFRPSKKDVMAAMTAIALSLAQGVGK